MPNFGDFSSKRSKTDVTFEISTFEIGYMRNLVKIRKLILFSPKGLSLGIWTQNLGKRMSDMNSAPSKSGTSEFLLKILGGGMADLRSAPSK